MPGDVANLQEASRITFRSGSAHFADEQ